jgi:hypothetical protein
VKNQKSIKDSKAVNRLLLWFQKINIFWLVILPILVFLFLLVGCARQIPDVGIPSKYLNRYLEIQPSYGFNNFRVGESIVLDVVARTDVEVEVNFAQIRIFMFDEKLKDWREIKDNSFSGAGIFRGADLLPDYFSKPPDILLSKSCISSRCQETETFGVDPDVQDMGKSVDVLVVISGFVYENGKKTNQITGAYIVFTLRP